MKSRLIYQVLILFLFVSCQKEVNNDSLPLNDFLVESVEVSPLTLEQEEMIKTLNEKSNFIPESDKLLKRYKTLTYLYVDLGYNIGYSPNQAVGIAINNSNFWVDHPTNGCYKVGFYNITEHPFLPNKYYVIYRKSISGNISQDFEDYTAHIYHDSFPTCSCGEGGNSTFYHSLYETIIKIDSHYRILTGTSNHTSASCF